MKFIGLDPCDGIKVTIPKEVGNFCRVALNDLSDFCFYNSDGYFYKNQFISCHVDKIVIVGESVYVLNARVLLLEGQMIAKEISDVATFKGHVLMSIGNQLLEFKDSKVGTRQVFRHKIISIATSQNHALILTEIGTIYAAGSNKYGQLGIGSVSVGMVNEFTLVEALEGLDVVGIACGLFHSAAWTKDGDVYSWGWNNRGQCGTSESFPEPRLIEEIDNVEFVSCGNWHTLFNTNDGVWSCGWNKYGQTGQEKNDTSTLGRISTTALKAVGIGWNTFL